MRTRHVGGPAVQQQVAERRPDHPDAVLGEYPEIRRLEPVCVDRDERRRECPTPVSEMECGEVLTGGRTETLGEMEDESVGLAEPGEERLGISGVDIGDPRVG